MRKAEEATLPAATIKSIISIVAPGKPSEKNWGEQCLMIVLTISLGVRKEGGKNILNKSWVSANQYS